MKLSPQSLKSVFVATGVLGFWSHWAQRLQFDSLRVLAGTWAGTSWVELNFSGVARSFKPLIGEVWAHESLRRVERNEVPLNDAFAS